MGVITLSTLTIRQAAIPQFEEILELLGESISWLRGKGLDQWSTWENWRTKMRPSLERGDVWLLLEDETLVGTITVETAGDPDFWSPNELGESSAYVSKLAIRRDWAGKELGQLLLEWASDHAYRYGCDWMRLDAWKGNDRLHAYYLDHGWKHIRTVDNPNRSSGALFQVATRPLEKTELEKLKEVPEIPAIAAPMSVPSESPDRAGNWQPGHIHRCEQFIVEQQWLSPRPMTVVPGYRYRIRHHDGQWKLDVSQPGPSWKESGKVIESSLDLDPQTTYVITHDEREPCAVRLAELRQGHPLAVSPVSS